MPKVISYILLTSFILGLPLAFSQENQSAPPQAPEEDVVLERGESEEVIPGVTVSFDSNFTDANFVPVARIAFSPERPELTLNRGERLGGFSVSVSSIEADTEVRVEVSEPDRLIYTGSDEWIPLIRGYLVSVGFTAVGPHSGIIRLYNRDEQLVAEIPYSVKEAKQLRQTVNGTVGAQADFLLDENETPYGYSFGLNYSVGHVSNGWVGNVGANYDPDDGTLAGSVGASYTW